jgi:hypothetical protein
MTGESDLADRANDRGSNWRIEQNDLADRTE